MTFEVVGEADINAVIKAMMRKRKISFKEASAIVISSAMGDINNIYSGLNGELKTGMQKIVDVVDSNKLGMDARLIDPVLRMVAKQEKHLNIHFEDCSSLAMQCAEVRRRAGY